MRLGSRSAGGAGARSLHASAVSHENFYEVLGLSRGASKAQIKSQFYKLSKEYHPDVNATDDAKSKFQRVSEAYATLGTDSSRYMHHATCH